jgi:hypothetical protein
VPIADFDTGGHDGRAVRPVAPGESDLETKNEGTDLPVPAGFTATEETGRLEVISRIEFILFAKLSVTPGVAAKGAGAISFISFPLGNGSGPAIEVCTVANASAPRSVAAPGNLWDRETE